MQTIDPCKLLARVLSALGLQCRSRERHLCTRSSKDSQGSLGVRIFTAIGLKDLVVCEANVARAFEHGLKAMTPTNSHTVAVYND